jgi:hypothetical protein
MKHIVIFKYKPEATQDQIRRVTDTFRELKSKNAQALSSVKTVISGRQLNRI